MSVVTLPNGMVVETATDFEAAFLYSEIFEANAYLKHGLEIDDGDCVFDVGANVGLFSASLAQRRHDLRLVLFEPMPRTFALLEQNAARLLGDAQVTLVQAGVSSEPGTMTFEYDPTSTIAAGASPFLREIEASTRSARRRAGLLAWNQAAVDDGERAGVINEATARRMHAALDNPILRPLMFGAIGAFYAVRGLNSRRLRQRIECPLTTISDAMRTHEVDRIDLLKIDVEGAEWAVLEGIEPSHWPAIRQLTLEVHDVDNRVARVRSLLEGKGYHVAVEQDDWRIQKLAGIQMVYARR